MLKTMEENKFVLVDTMYHKDEMVPMPFWAKFEWAGHWSVTLQAEKDSDYRSVNVFLKAEGKRFYSDIIVDIDSVTAMPVDVHSHLPGTGSIGPEDISEMIKALTDTKAAMEEIRRRFLTMDIRPLVLEQGIKKKNE